MLVIQIDPMASGREHGGGCVSFSDCLKCSNFQDWEQKGEGKMCHHEYKDRKSRGYYDGTWEDHPENFEPETFKRIQEEKRLNEQINRKMDNEREELQKMAENLAKDSQSLEEFYKYMYGKPDKDEEIETDEDEFDNYDNDEEEYY